MRPGTGLHPVVGNKPANVTSKLSVASPYELGWPPSQEDLRRLYTDQRLSASKIAKVYGLKYASPKTAESTILHHLKKNGISRRDPAAHVRKVNEMMVDDWVARYQKGESLKQIAGEAVDPVTVFYHLHKRGLKLRERIEAQTKAVTIHSKKPFQASAEDRAYLAGVTAGDFWAGKHGRAVRIRLGTTHPAMSRLFHELFGTHGPIYEYPKADRLARYEWILDCDLDSSFEFLLSAKRNPPQFVTDERTFWSFFAGFFDAEGSIHYHRKDRRGAFEMTLTNSNLKILQEIAAKLRAYGVMSGTRKVRVNRAKAIESGITNPAEFMWKLIVWRYQDVNHLLDRVPFRHNEKSAKAAIAIRLAFREKPGNRAALLEEWRLLLRKIDDDCKSYVEKAKRTIESKSTLRHQKIGRNDP